MKKITKWTLIISTIIMIAWIILLSLNENIQRTDPFHNHETKQVLLKNRLINHVHIPPNSSVYYWVYGLHTHPMPVNHVLTGKDISWLDLSQPTQWGNYQIKSIGYYHKHNHLLHELTGVGIEAIAGQIPNPKWFHCELKDNILFFESKFSNHNHDWRAKNFRFSGCLNAQKAQFFLDKHQINLNHVGIVQTQIVPNRFGTKYPEKVNKGVWLIKFAPAASMSIRHFALILDEQQQLIYASGLIGKQNFTIEECVYPHSAYFEVDFLVQPQNAVWQWDFADEACQNGVQTHQQWLNWFQQYIFNKKTNG